MKFEDVERMAEQADIDPYDMCEDHRIGVHRLMAFAKLVLAAEREACANVCLTEWSNEAERMYGQECAAAIRARSDA